jgi:hypothetical protein
MRWTITLEFTPDGGQPLVRQISTISRSMTDVRPEEVGLTLQEGRELRGIERQVIANQVHVYTLCFRCCGLGRCAENNVRWNRRHLYSQKNP